MYLFVCLLLGLFLSLPAVAEDAQPHFTFTSEQTAAADKVEPDAAGAQPDASMLDQARMERRNVRQRLLDMLGINRLVPQGHFTAFGLKTRWTLTLPDQETVAVRVSARW
ncbi:MAG: hypothetical protein PSX71_06540 [bacterium]|nr:hypothetical protein [bacterium]